MRALLPLLILAGCVGTLEFPGFVLDGDDDDSALGDDDDSADDDDATSDDDDSVIGGDLFCGLTVAPPGGAAVSAYTGGADWAFDYDPVPYEVVWEGCEAQHFWDDAGEVLCAMSWRGVGQSYVGQFQSTNLVVRFEVDWTLEENTCRSNHPDATNRTDYYRVTIPYEDGDIVVLTDPDPQASPGTMQTWTTVPYTGQGDEPSSISIDYATEFVSGG